MTRILPGARPALLLSIILVAVSVLLASAGPSAAAPIEARWSLFDRANATSFVAGLAPSSTGYEIVSFAAVGPSAGLATYQYGGADLTPPVPAIVGCTATVGLTTLDLQVNGAYPFAGCVYFVGVTNSGETPIQVDLGSLDSHATVTCNVPGCQPSDVDVVAGGTTPADADTVCRSTGGTVTNAGLTYTLPPGVTFVCPLFVTVLQPAKEQAQYVVVITPPPLREVEPSEAETPTPTATPPPSFPPVDPPPGQPATSSIPTPVPPTATPTRTPLPTSIVAGERTLGASATPLAPATGSGVLIQRAPGASGTNPLVIVTAGGALLSIMTALYRARRQRDHPAAEKAAPAPK